MSSIKCQKQSKKHPRLETVEEARILDPELNTENSFKKSSDVRDTVSISLQKDVHKHSVFPMTIEEAVASSVVSQLWREKLQKYLRSLRFHALVTILVLLDVFLVLLDLILTGHVLPGNCIKDEDCKESFCTNSTVSLTNATICRLAGFKRDCVSAEDETVPVILILNGISLFILFLFIIEIALKIIAFRLRFFKKFFEVFDAVIVITSFIMEFVKYVFTLEQAISLTDKNVDSIEKLQFFDLLIAFRLWRVVRIITGALASYNTAKTQSHKHEVQKIVATETERYNRLFQEYQYTSDEVLRLRQVLLSMKANPFPAGYQLTLFEVQELGIDSSVYDLVDRRGSTPNETII